MSVRLAVFASGGGSNLQSILDHFHTQRTPALRVELVISDRPDVGALERARRAGAATRVVAVSRRNDGDVADEMLSALGAAQIEMIALAGYLRRVPAAVVAAFAGRIVNIHPALLPSFGGEGMYGKHVHRAVLAAGCTVSGATVHHVDEEYDRGRIIAQWPVPVLPDDDADRLAARVLAVEHRLYPAALAWLTAAAAERNDRGTPGEPHFALLAADPPLAQAIQSLIRNPES